MTSKNDADDILKRLQVLEEENARLRQLASTNKDKPATVIESSYKGHPTLVFESSGRPFTLGLRKLRILNQVWPQVELFLGRHPQKDVDRLLQDSDDVKI